MSEHDPIPRILDESAAGTRLSDSDALSLLTAAPLPELALAADEVRRRKNDPRIATYQIDRNVNYTNVCIYRCRFCAFYRDGKSPEGYVLTRDELATKIRETLELGGSGILLQGGVHAALPFEWYEETFRFVRREFPRIHLHALSAPEIWYLAKRARIGVRDVLLRLRSAGLQSLPGGGAEILDDEVRREIWSLTKAPEATWIDVHRQAHAIGMCTTATMMFGVGEPLEARVHHLRLIRDLQDESLAAGSASFTAFIPWTFQEENTELSGKVELSGGVDYLRTLAVSRLYLDNVRHIQGSWVTQGAKIGQVSLSFGADDLGSIMIEENVVAAAGARNRMNQLEMERVIREAGYEPRQRGTIYDACPDECCARFREG
jgi:cyclic dehypoxanthinyl futalosine synthase